MKDIHGIQVRVGDRLYANLALGKGNYKALAYARVIKINKGGNTCVVREYETGQEHSVRASSIVRPRPWG